MPEITEDEWNKRVLRVASFYLVLVECEDCGGPKNNGDVCLHCQKESEAK